MPPPPARRPYHHGNLRSELVVAALDVMRETGVGGFSVAQAAKRAGVSSGAPYRHFSGREALLAACATVCATELAGALETAAAAAGPDPVERFAALSGAYARFVLDRRVGLDLIYADGLQAPRYADLHAQSRRITDVQLALAADLPGGPEYRDVFRLLEAQMATAHGFASLQLQGGLARSHHSTEEIVERATDAARLLVAGRRSIAERPGLSSGS